LLSVELGGFHRPESVGEALRLKHDLGPAALYLGGGTWVNSNGFDRPIRHLISLSELGALRRLERTRNGLLIGAMVTLQETLDSPLVPAPLKEALGHVANRNVRNQATLGGTVAAGRRASDVLPALIALECVAIVENPGSSAMVPVIEYVASGSRPSEGLITGVVVPPEAGRGCAVASMARSTASLAVVAAAVSLGRDGDLLKRPIIAVAGASFDAQTVRAVERALDGDMLPPPEALEALVRGHVTLEDDSEHTGAFKQQVAGALVARAFAAAYAAAATPETGEG